MTRPGFRCKFIICLLEVFFMVVVKDIASIIGVVDESETDEGMEREAIFYESESLPTRQFCYAEVERLIEGTVW